MQKIKFWPMNIFPSHWMFCILDCMFHHLNSLCHPRASSLVFWSAFIYLFVQILNRVLACVTTAKRVQFSEAVLTAGNECVGVLLASMEPCGQLMETVLAYGLDQLDCCRACGPDYNLAVLSLLTLVWPFSISNGLISSTYQLENSIRN